MADSIATLALLIGLELVLGVDNILVISIFVERLPDSHRNRARIIGLALSFLITIGITIFLKGMHKSVPKAYIYLPMGFALFVELPLLRYEHNILKIARTERREDL